jgi:hypothetical protein
MKHGHECETERFSEVGMFGAIGNAAADLNREARRVAEGKRCTHTITCGELEKVLSNIKHATKLLERVKFSDCEDVPPCPVGVGDYSAYSRGYRDAMTAVEAAIRKAA